MQLSREGLRELGLHPIPVAEADDKQIAAVMVVRGVSEALASHMLIRPAIRVAAMVGSGEADVMVAGIETPRKRVIEAAMLAVGLDESASSPSSFFLMVFPDGREFIFADCAVTVGPEREHWRQSRDRPSVLPRPCLARHASRCCHIQPGGLV